MTLTDYRTLGQSGLIISPLALGTMNFGNTNWGIDENESKNIFNSYVENGGNFIDTADVYSNGKSEEFIGRIVTERNLRDRLVLATKFSFNGDAGNPNAGGNGRKNLYRSLENSLRRLNTDYIDMYWVHVWDMVTPIEEILQSLNILLQSGKIRYFGFSNIPAWYNSKASTLAKVNNMSSSIGLQIHYALTSRIIEREHIPSALDSGQGIVPWSPLAYGFLTGKYKSAKNENITNANGRLNKYNPLITEFTERHWNIISTLEKIAEQTNHSIAQIALAWVVQKKAVASTLIGVSNVKQLNSNIESLQIQLSKEQINQLDLVSDISQENPYSIFTPEVRKNIFGGHTINENAY